MKKIILIALIAALLAGALLYVWLGNVEARNTPPAPQQEPTVTVYLTAVEIPAFTPLKQEHVTEVNYPARLVPENAATDPRDIAGKVCSTDLVPGQMLLLDMLGSLEEKAPGLSYRIPEGMRAMTISITGTAGVDGYILAGDRIDLLVSVTAADEELKGKMKLSKTKETELPGVYTGVLLENVEVIELGDVNFEGGMYDSLTLALRPEDCMLISSVENTEGFTGFTALLRGREDEGAMPRGWYTFGELGEGGAK